MDKYCCNICSKNYASYQSLWIHNKKFHRDTQNINIINSHNNPINSHNNPINSHKNPINSHKNPTNSHNDYINKSNFDNLQCYYCSKFFKHTSTKYAHIKKCKEKYSDIKIIENL